MNDFPTDEISGPVLFPGDEAYDAETAGFQTAYRHRPSVIVGAGCPEDVRVAVAFAAARKVPVAVQATGHGLSVPADDGVLITTGRMDGVRVDAASRTAWIEAGVRWEQVVEAAAAHGLAPLSGSAPGVGAVSYTLGGGIGLLAREFGYAADRVRAADIVTADGRLRRVTAESDPDLFWALRGAGHNFGVVTALEVELVEVSRVWGGGMFFAADLVDQVLETYRTWSASVPEELTSSVGLIDYPDMEQLPEKLRGRYVAHIRLVLNGSAEEGERLVAPLRAIGPRLIDSLRVLPYTESGSVYQDPPFPHAYSGTNVLLRELDAGALRAVSGLTGPSAPLMSVVDLRQMGGALARRPEGGSAVGRRDAGYILRVITMLQDPDSHSVARDLQDTVERTLEPWTVGRSLPFVYGDGERAGEDLTRSGFDPADYARLARLKAVHDPANLFRFNRNITPMAHPGQTVISYLR
ncbi:FAD-binding oxidoreductase [Streptomyces sp. NBC_00344]|uniref:FAD-binding oxidoreductase n=1 Tax=Streptomyces sp. NBC_00344 TaxID=2975720 RepID=UPI002E2194FC